MEVLSHDVGEVILERLPAKSLIRFKHVSKQWKSTIESKNFQERHMIYPHKSRDQHVLFLTFSCADDDDDDTINISTSSLLTIVTLPMKKRYVCPTSFDGLVCLYNSNKTSIAIMNPTTRWHRTLPLSNSQKVRPHVHPLFGFGKDKFNGTYKLVLLYNYDQDTTISACEVFDFSTNAWRYVTPSSPHEIVASLAPVYVDGLLHWFTKCHFTKILSFDLHTETFQVMATSPASVLDVTKNIVMCNLNNRLCVSSNYWSNQLIWLFDAESKKWNVIYSRNLHPSTYWYHHHASTVLPIAVLKEKNKLLLYERVSSRELKIYDNRTGSYSVVFKSKASGYPLCYFQSLISLS